VKRMQPRRPLQGPEELFPAAVPDASGNIQIRVDSTVNPTLPVLHFQIANPLGSVISGSPLPVMISHGVGVCSGASLLSHLPAKQASKNGRSVEEVYDFGGANMALANLCHATLMNAFRKLLPFAYAPTVAELYA
jgi:hypothetical protein